MTVVTNRHKSKVGQRQEAWENDATARVDSWLMADGVKAIVERLVHGWNDNRLLLVDLADELEDLVHERLIQDFSEAEAAELVDGANWNQIAETYALAICDVTEAQLTARRQRRQHA